MKPRPNTSHFLSFILYVLYILFFASLVFSFRAFSSISTGLILLAGFYLNKLENGSFISENLNNPFLLSCSVYFLLQFTSFFNSHNLSEDWRQIMLKTGLVFTPLAVSCCSYINAVTRRKLLTIYAFLLAAAGVFCITMAFIHYVNTSDPTHFFYHPLVSPLNQHAVYFSLQVFIALLYLMESAKKKDWLVKKVFHLILVLFFSILLVLLSSKLVIIFFGIYLFFYLLNFWKTYKVKISVTVGFISFLFLGLFLLLITNNPVSNRFKDLAKGDLGIVRQDKYEPSVYFNGLQFRLLQWRLVPEILNENKSWWTGMGSGNAQNVLSQKYISKNMYRGKPGTTDTGYLNYNTHNQFLESLLKNGIPGAAIFLFTCFSLVLLARKKKNRVMNYTVVLLILYAFTESIFETQYGILIFTFFPLFLSRE